MCNNNQPFRHLRSGQTVSHTFKNKFKGRKGAAVVELAMTLPVLFVFIFGTIEICQRLYIKQSVVIAAYEACRVAARQTSDTETVLERCTRLLAQEGVAGGMPELKNLTRGRDDLDEVETGDAVRVRITTPWADNVISRYVVQDLGSFQVEAIMLRE